MHEDDPPTPKDSGSLAIFETTCDECISKLAGFDTDRADELREEARSLLIEVRGWRMKPPNVTERAHAVTRVMDLHRGVSEYVTPTILRR